MEIDWVVVAQRLDEELLRRSLSTQTLADKAGVDRKTVDRLRHGKRVRTQTLAWIEQALGASLRSEALTTPSSLEIAVESLGGYTRSNYRAYEGDYFGFRRSFDAPGRIICYHLRIYWDPETRRLAFDERQRNAANGKVYEYRFKGAVGVPAGLGVLHFICVGGGAARLTSTTMMRDAQDTYMRGFMLALNEVADFGYYPTTSPVYLIKQTAETPEEIILDRIGAYDAADIWKSDVVRELDETERRFAPGAMRR